MAVGFRAGAAGRRLPAALEATSLRGFGSAPLRPSRSGQPGPRPRPPPSPHVVRAMRERGERLDPQQRRRPLPPGHHHYYATCHPGLEAVVAAELAGPAIGAADVHPGRAGVSFSGDAAVGYRANLWLRSAIRVLMLLQETLLDGRRPAGDEVYEGFREAVDWARLLAPGQTFSVESRVWSCSNLTSSQLLLVRGRDAVCDAVRDARGTRPAPPEPGRVADVPLYCTAYHDRLTLYRDMSGASLHRRGYRQAMHRAALNEAAAAGILRLAGWGERCTQEGAVLADPMCGSGTFLIEAALMATNTAPGSFRRWWPFTQWRDSFDRQAWAVEVERAEAARRPPPPGVEVWGNDVHRGALSLALRDAAAAGAQRLVRLHHGECRDWALPRPPALVVSNPPWGQRLRGRDEAGGGAAPASGEFTGAAADEALQWWDAPPEERAREPRQQPRREGPEGEAEALRAAWWDLSSFLKRQAPGSTAFLLSGSPEATKGLRMKAERRHPLTLGGVDCRLLQYSVRGVDAARPDAAALRGGAS